MHIKQTTSLNNSEKEAVLLLWNKEYPATLQHQSIAELDAYLEGLTGRNHYLLCDDKDHMQGWGFTFLREDERWFAIIIDSTVQGRGYGTTLLNAIKADEPKLYGWATDHNNALKSDGTTYRSPIDFYIKNGFAIDHSVRLETEKLSAVKICWTK